jgi:hypothetical protein
LSVDLIISDSDLKRLLQLLLLACEVYVQAQQKGIGDKVGAASANDAEVHLVDKEVVT